MTAEEQRRVDRKIAALEHRIDGLTECVRFLASKIVDHGMRHGDDVGKLSATRSSIEQKLTAELATRPR